MDSYGRIVKLMPRYPFIKEAVTRPGAPIEKVAVMFGLTPEALLLALDGRGDFDMTIEQLVDLHTILGGVGMGDLMFTPDADIDGNTLAAIEEGAAAIVDREEDGELDFHKYADALKCLNDYQKWYATTFIKAIFATATATVNANKQKGARHATSY
jgi:hypothetical protein